MIVLFEVVGALFLVVAAVIAIVVYVGVMKASAPEACLREVGPEEMPEAYEAVMAYEEWAEEEGFEFAGTFLLGGVMSALIGVWQQAGEGRFFCPSFIGGRLTYDLVTVFEGDAGLTTASTKAGQLLPCPPGSFMQAFERTTVREQWKKHRAAEEFLVSGGRVRRRSSPVAFEEVFTDSVRRHMAYVRSLRFWPVRAVYWYFVRQNVLKNRSVQQQVESQWLSGAGEM